MSNADTLNVAVKAAEVGLNLETAEHPDDRRARIANEARTAKYTEFRNMALFFVVLLGRLGAGSLLTYMIFFSVTVDAETKKFSQTMLTALVSGSLSFLLGRSIGAR